MPDACTASFAVVMLVGGHSDCPTIVASSTPTIVVSTPPSPLDPTIDPTVVQHSWPMDAPARPATTDRHLPRLRSLWNRASPF